MTREEIMCGPCDGRGHLPGPCPEASNPMKCTACWKDAKGTVQFGSKLFPYCMRHLGGAVRKGFTNVEPYIEGCNEPDCDHLICPKCEGTGVQEFIGGQHYE